MTQTKNMTWAGRIISALVVVPFLPSAVMKVTMNPQVISGMEHFGFPQSSIMTLAVLEILSVLLYAIPRTAILGAILVTGYLGGAICTHFRMGENVLLQVSIGVLAWVGLYLRDARVRALLPLR